VILASRSPRRHDLLALIGIAHEVRPADIDESYLPGEPPAAHAERLARAKALAVRDPDAVVIGSDTIVGVGGVVLGKPVDEADAYGIQGYGATIVTRVDGDYFAVMGLALNRLVRLVERVGLRYAFGSIERPARA